MVNALTWLLAAELIGLIAFPLAFVLFSGLKDRGYSVAKPLGLILLSWPLWMLGSLHIVPTTPLTLWAALGLFAVVSGWFAMRRRAEMLDFVRRERRALLLGEVVFLVLYGAWVVYRFYDPSIDSTEKPMDFAFLNASILAGFFPPEDPWLRGHDLPYYYFGYLMMGNLTELTFIPSRISYNLALALIPAMAGSAAYGLVYNLTRAHGASSRKGMGFALVAPVLLLAVSNLQGALEFVRLRQWAPASFWDWLGIKNFGALETASWRPTEHLWWWRGTRVIDSLNEQGGSLDYTITEFPFFSFLLGDLHPHVMSIPFVLLFLAFGLSTFMSPARLSARWVMERPGAVLVAALLLGGLAFVNAWDIVTFAALWAALLAFKAVRQEDGAWTRALRQAWLPAAATLSLAILLYLPFYVSLDSQATGILPVGEVGTRPVHFLIIWGLFLVALLPFLLRQIPRALSMGAGAESDAQGDLYITSTSPHTRIKYGAGSNLPPQGGGRGFSPPEEGESERGRAKPVVGSREFWPRATIALGVVLTPLFVWATWQLAWSTLTWSTDPIVVVGERFLNTAPLALILFVSLYSLIRYAESGVSPVMVFVLSIVSLALLLALGPEFLRVDDLFHNRMNTIFKLYYQAWTLLAIASAFGLYFLNSTKPPSGSVYKWALRGWWVLAGGLFLASLYYPVEAVLTKGGNGGENTLDGLAYIARSSPGEYAAIQWLQENGKEGEGIVEAVGDSWSPYGRVSSSTGMPTVLGWPWHEHQWRGSREPFEGREEDVRTIYTTPDASEAVRLLKEYDVQYVMVGPRERASYGLGGLAKFPRIGEAVFESEDVTIYRVRE